MSARLSIGLAAAALGLAGIVAWQALAPIEPLGELPAVAMPMSRNLAALPVPAPRPERDFAIINARSAFDPARQPATEPIQPGQTSTAAPPDLTLIGVVLAAHDSVALLREGDARAAVGARIGQVVEGWQLVRIEPGLVVFRAGATDYTVKLRAAQGIAQPPAADNPAPLSTAQPGQ